MIAYQPKNAVSLRQRCVHPSPVLSCVNPSDGLHLGPLSELTSGLLRATLLPPGAVNEYKSAIISRSCRPKVISRSYQSGLCGLSSYLGFDSGMKKQSLFVTKNLIYLQKFIPKQSVFFNSLTVIRYRDNYSIQRLHACSESPGFSLLKPSISFVGRNFHNLEIPVPETRGLVRLKNSMLFFVKFFSRSSQLLDNVNSNCNSPPGNSFGSMETRCLKQPYHSNSICVRRVIHELGTRLSMQPNLKQYMNSCVRKSSLGLVDRWINPPPRSLFNLRPFLHPNSIGIYQKLKLFSLIPSKIPWSGISGIFQQALSTMCQTNIIHNFSRRYHQPGGIQLNYLLTH